MKGLKIETMFHGMSALRILEQCLVLRELLQV